MRRGRSCGFLHVTCDLCHRFGEEFATMRDAAAASIVELQKQSRAAAARAEEQRAQFEMSLRELDEALRNRMEKVESNVIKPDSRCLSCLQFIPSSIPAATYSNTQLDRARSKSPPMSQSQGLLRPISPKHFNPQPPHPLSSSSATISFIGPDTRTPPRASRPGSAPIRTIQQRKVAASHVKRCM